MKDIIDSLRKNSLLKTDINRQYSAEYDAELKFSKSGRKKFFVWVFVIILLLMFLWLIGSKENNQENITSIIIEAESGQLKSAGKYSHIAESNRGGEKETESYLGDGGAYMEYNIDVAVSGEYTMYLRINDDAKHSSGTRNATIIVNNTSIKYKHNSHNTNGWEWIKLGKVQLNKGINHIIIKKDKTTSAAFIIDKFKFESLEKKTNKTSTVIDTPVLEMNVIKYPKVVNCYTQVDEIVVRAKNTGTKKLTFDDLKNGKYDFGVCDGDNTKTLACHTFKTSSSLIDVKDFGTIEPGETKDIVINVTANKYNALTEFKKTKTNGEYSYYIDFSQIKSAKLQLLISKSNIFKVKANIMNDKNQYIKSNCGDKK